MIVWLLNDELERIWKEALMACMKYYCSICLEGVRKTQNAYKDSHWPGLDSNQVPPEYRLKALPSNHPVWYNDSWFADIKHSHLLPQLTCILHVSHKIPGNTKWQIHSINILIKDARTLWYFCFCSSINPGSTRAKSTSNHCHSTLMCLHTLSVRCASPMVYVKRHTTWIWNIYVQTTKGEKVPGDDQQVWLMRMLFGPSVHPFLRLVISTLQIKAHCRRIQHRMLSILQLSLNFYLRITVRQYTHVQFSSSPTHIYQFSIIQLCLSLTPSCWTSKSPTQKQNL
jgi:hypothetical protein